MSAASTIGGGRVGGGQYATIGGGENNTVAGRPLPLRLRSIRSTLWGAVYTCKWCPQSHRTWRGFTRHTCR